MAISVDDTTVVRWTGTPASGTNITSGTFTPPNNSVIVLAVSVDGSTASINPTVAVSGGSLTWTNRAEMDPGTAGANGGHASIWTAPVVTGASMSISVNRTSSDATARVSCKAYLVTGHDTTTPTGVTGSGHDTTNNATTAGVTSQTAGVIFYAATDWTGAGGGTTPPTSSDLTEDAASYSAQIDALAGYKTIASAGASVTANLDAAGTATAAWNWAAVEVRASAVAFTWQPLTAPEVPARRPTVPVSYL
jgi:hypothetical protein